MGSPAVRQRGYRVAVINIRHNLEVVNFAALYLFIISPVSNSSTVQAGALTASLIGLIHTFTQSRASLYTTPSTVTSRSLFFFTIRFFTIKARMSLPPIGRRRFNLSLLLNCSGKRAKKQHHGLSESPSLSVNDISDSVRNLVHMAE